MDREVSKQEFKEVFFRYGVSNKDSGFTADFWNQFYEDETDAHYFFTEPTSPDQNRMFLSEGFGTHRIFLMSEEEEEASWGPGSDK
jgi:hypothetical protein